MHKQTLMHINCTKYNRVERDQLSYLLLRIYSYFICSICMHRDVHVCVCVCGLFTVRIYFSCFNCSYLVVCPLAPPISLSSRSIVHKICIRFNKKCIFRHLFNAIYLQYEAHLFVWNSYIHSIRCVRVQSVATFFQSRKIQICSHTSAR